MWIPVIMFFGGSCIDLMFGWYAEHPTLQLQACDGICLRPLYVGRCGQLADQFRSKRGFPRRDVLGGLLLGVTNFGSLYFLLLAFDSGLFPRAMVVPLLNLSVIVLATLGGVMLLKDIPNHKARWG